MSALDELLQRIESDLHIVRRDVRGALAPIRAALDSYERAVEESAVQAYCRDHALKSPRLVGLDKGAAEANIRSAIASLFGPESSPTPLAPPQNEQLSQGEVETPQAKATPSKGETNEVASPDPIALQFQSKFPQLTLSASRSRLLVFGAFSGRTKSLPGPLGKATDWIDTAGDGNRAVTAAVKRIRQGSVFAVIICDQAISHQHAEPAVAEARAKKLPIGYAAKGGNASLARALETIETLLSSSER